MWQRQTDCIQIVIPKICNSKLSKSWIFSNTAVRTSYLAPFLLIGRKPLVGQGASLSRLHYHTQTHTTLGRTPLYEWSARRRDLYLTTHNTHKGQTYMPLGGIRTRNLSRWAAADPHLRQRGHWDRLPMVYTYRYTGLNATRQITSRFVESFLSVDSSSYTVRT